jgi:hypothetical protein
MLCRRCPVFMFL